MSIEITRFFTIFRNKYFIVAPPPEHEPLIDCNHWRKHKEQQEKQTGKQQTTEAPQPVGNTAIKTEPEASIYRIKRFFPYKAHEVPVIASFLVDIFRFSHTFNPL